MSIQSIQVKPLLSCPWLQKFMMVAALYFGCLHTTAFALDINQASARQLTSLKGIGSKMAERIIQERQKAGKFQSWPDVIKRVAGIGAKKAAQLQAEGLSIGSTAEATVAVPKVITEKTALPRQRPPSRPVQYPNAAVSSAASPNAASIR